MARDDRPGEGHDSRDHDSARRFAGGVLMWIVVLVVVLMPVLLALVLMD